MAHDRAELFGVIREVRNRWRRRLAARGAVIVLAGTVLAILLSAHGLETFRFTSGSILAFRLIAVAVFAGLTWFGLLVPLRQRVSDSQVALYLEESNPSLQAAILSAIEATEDSPARASHSPRLVERLVEQAVEQCRAIDHERSADRTAFRRHVATLVGVGVAAALIVALGPAYLRHGISALLVVSRSAEASSPYRIDVQPGSVKIPRGGDQTVRASLIGFTAKDAALMVRTAPGGTFERMPLVASSAPATFEGMIFRLEKSADYFVESNGVRSPVFSIGVLDLPTVSKLTLEYRFPTYTNLPPKTVEGVGDIAALRGSDVLVHIQPTMKTPGGSLILKTGTVPLTLQADGSLTGTVAVKEPGIYRIELIGPRGEKVEASSQYTIDVLDDQPPTVSITKPGRDTSATAVEEVFAEIKADDDYGIKQLQLVYSVNGGPQTTISLFGGGRTLPQVTAGHTIYLEELELKPGDFVSYFAKATDNDAVQGAKTTSSDIYFVQIRPFKKDFRQAQSQGGGGGGGQQGEVGDLSRQQREIVAATFNTVRDKAKLKADKYRENVVFLNLAQTKLREQVEELVGKMNARLGSANNDQFKQIAEALPKAADQMKLAEADLKALKPDAALVPEQKALKLLQEAEQQYEAQVSQQRGGGGGGSQGAMAEDLADLFELELDKLANQYEVQKRAEQQGADRQVDQLSEKLKELAKRQQQEAERQRRQAQAGTPQSSSGSSGGQRALAQEMQEAARQLQQLSREQQRPELSEAARQLQQAADQMRQAAASGGQDGGAMANAALEKLREAQQKLDQNQSGRTARDIQNALRQAQELAEEQKQVSSEVQGLEPTTPGRAAKARTLAQRKDAMEAKVGNLQQQVDRLAGETRREEREASRKLDEAATGLRDKKVKEKIRYSKGSLQGESAQFAKAMEDDISANLDAVRNKIAEAAAAVGAQSKQNAMAKAAEQARDLVRGMESLEQRMRERAAGGERNQQNGQTGRGQGQQPGQGDQQAQGQRGQQGQQQGQRGQQGQQGQQGQGQGQPGQQNSPQRGQDGQVGSPAQAAMGMGDARAPMGGGGRFSNEDTRQFRREMQELGKTAQELRQRLQNAGASAKELDEVMRDIQALGSERLFSDPRSLQQLQAAAIDKMKKFEFNLRRKLDSGNDSLALSGSDEVPSGFRQAIEEYYRSLSRKQSK